MAAMSQRDRRALTFLGVAVGLFLVLQLDIFAPSSASGSTTSDAALDALEQRLQLAQVQARQRPLTEAELSAAQRRLEKTEGRLLASADPALAQAEMRSVVGQLLDAEGIPLCDGHAGARSLRAGAARRRVHLRHRTDGQSDGRHRELLGTARDPGYPYPARQAGSKVHRRDDDRCGISAAGSRARVGREGRRRGLPLGEEAA